MTLCPRFLSSIAAVTPLIPAPTTIAVAITLEATERSRLYANIRGSVLSLRAKHPPSQSGLRVEHKNVRPFACHRSARLREPRHTIPEIDPDKFLTQLEILGLLLSIA